MIKRSVFSTVDENQKIWISVASDFGRKAWRRYQFATVLMHLSKIGPLHNILQKKVSEFDGEADMYFEMALDAFEKAEFLK